MGKFTYNNSVTVGNRMSPFYANYRFHPVTSDPISSGPLNPASKLYMHCMHAIHEGSRRGL